MHPDAVFIEVHEPPEESLLIYHGSASFVI